MLISQAVRRDQRGRREGHRRSEGAGRRRPGHHVRLRHRREPRAHAAADPPGAPAHQGPRRRSAQRATSTGSARTPSRRSRSSTKATPRFAVATILISTQHADTHRRPTSATTSRRCSRRASSASGSRPDAEVIVNPSGSFVHGGPSADCGVTGTQDHRRLVRRRRAGTAAARSAARIPSKVDRSGAYYCRYVARRIVQAGLAKRAEVQVSYAIGRAKPMSIKVDTFGTGDEAQGREVRLRQLRLPPGEHHPGAGRCSSRSTGRRPTTGTSARPDSPGRSRCRWPSSPVRDCPIGRRLATRRPGPCVRTARQPDE